MEFRVRPGVLLHVSSLPSYGGIGDLGPAAHEFVAFLAAAKQHVWQVLPLCPTGYGNSPYAGSSAFAGNPYADQPGVSFRLGMDRWRAHCRAGRPRAAMWTSMKWRRGSCRCSRGGGEFSRPRAARREAGRAVGGVRGVLPRRGELAGRLRVLRRAAPEFNTGAWTAWPEPVRKRRPEALAQIAAKHGRALAQEQVLQFAFSKQWSNCASGRGAWGIRILGDVAIFVNMDSADVWVHPDSLNWTRI
jgi:4-alpha-glucanotransferase